MKLIIMILSSLFTLSIYTSTTFSAEYPNRSVTLTIATPPGNSVDVMGRTFLNYLKKSYNFDNMIVLNLPGASTSIGTNKVLSEKADGYTLLFASIDQVAAYNGLKAANYNMTEDFIPIAIIASGPFALITQPGKYKDFKDFVQQNQGKELTVGGVGYSGSTNFVSMEVLKTNNIKGRIIPYTSVPQLLSDVMEGRIDFMHITVQSGIKLVEAGKLQALAVTSNTRSKYLPEIPTYKEASGKSIEKYFWKGLFVKKGTSTEIVNSLREKTEKIKADPQFISDANKLSIDVAPKMSFNETLAFLKNEQKEFAKISIEFNIIRQ